MSAAVGACGDWLSAPACAHSGGDESDTALLTAWLDTADETACSFLVTRHRRRVVHIAAGVLGPGWATEAEDVAQEAFARAFERLHSLRDHAQFGAWVGRIAFNLAIERRRLARLRRPHVSVDDEMPTRDAESDWFVRRAVDELPPVPRAVLHLHYWLGYSVDEIAGLLQVPANTVKSHLARGRHRIARRLAGER
jgi:RNA polymerase sigma-70 factor (ECF subfamily)